MLLEFFPYTFYYYSTIFDIINKSGFNPCEHLLPLFSVSVRRLSFITDSVPPNSVFIRRCFLQYTTCKKRLLQHPPSKGLSKKCCLKKAPSERICRKNQRKSGKTPDSLWAYYLFIVAKAFFAAFFHISD